ncbi:hypothetical protein P691DRAFT_800502 [Macrolepiota fuliginosa MF-IS2]|uniref:Uncharacterized protein n=1 Tax=Macrolepiota fuliginosa MF-IS2 TaxID=1400762 RepID=A0A9P5XFP2_9AGAR|nr:hypothetical protein P691DRAFT_800502 [Macrolepiota fuliginosa MF-IS2]
MHKPDPLPGTGHPRPKKYSSVLAMNDDNTPQGSRTSSSSTQKPTLTAVWNPYSEIPRVMTIPLLPSPLLPYVQVVYRHRHQLPGAATGSLRRQKSKSRIWGEESDGTQALATVMLITDPRGTGHTRHCLFVLRLSVDTSS